MNQVLPPLRQLESMADFLDLTVEELAATYDVPAPAPRLSITQEFAEVRRMVADRQAESLAAREAGTSVLARRICRGMAPDPAEAAERLLGASDDPDPCDPWSNRSDLDPDIARYGVPDYAGGHLEARPPAANRGVELTGDFSSPEKLCSYLKLDWLSVTFPFSRMEAVVGVVSKWLGPPSPRSGGLHSYREGLGWPSSAACCWSPGRPEAFLSLNGDSLDLVPACLQHELLNALAALDARGTRVDCALTDVDRIASMSQVHAAAESDNFTGFLITDSHRPKKRGVLIGDSRTFGRRGKEGGGAYYIVYDKLLESRAKGEPEIDAIRYEVRFDGKKARAAFATLCGAADAESLAGVVGSLVGGAIDFLHRGEETHLDRMERVAWWTALVERLGALRLRVDRFVPSLPKTLFHLGRQWLGTIARAAAAYHMRDLNLFDHLNGAVCAWMEGNAHKPLTDLDLRFHADDVFFQHQDTDHAMDQDEPRPGGPHRFVLAPVGTPFPLG